VIDHSAMTVKVGDYKTGKAATALNEANLLQQVRRRRRQLGQMMTAFDIETAKRRLPSAEYAISRKVDGEFSVLIFTGGECFSLNPGGAIRLGAPFHAEATELLRAEGVEHALVGGELYAERTDGERPRVHDVSRVARNPGDQSALDRLRFAVFDIYDLDGEDLSARHGDSLAGIERLFGDGQTVHPVELVHGDKKAVFSKFNQWVLREGAEGVVARSDAAGVFKIKPRHNLDLAVVGFSEGIDDRAGLLHSLLVGIVRPDGTHQILTHVGGGFTDEQRAEILGQLSSKVVESEFSEVNSDRVAYQMIEPGPVVEISCLDVISRTSHGSTIDRMVLEFDAGKRCWSGVRRLPLCSIISPQYERFRDDKTASPDEVSIDQLTDVAEIPEVKQAAESLRLPTSALIRRAVATKQLKGATMVRKIVMWKTNKEDTSADFPAYVLHLTDYSPNRKSPLDHDMIVSSSAEQLDEMFEEWRTKYFVGGWTEQE